MEEIRPIPGGGGLKARQDRLLNIARIVADDRRLMRLAPQDRRSQILAIIAREYPTLLPGKREEYVDTVELILAR